jgi:hypothetical protein
LRARTGCETSMTRPTRRPTPTVGVWSAAGLLAALSLSIPTGARADVSKSVSASAGQVGATLAYRERTIVSEPLFSSLHMTISRGGQVLYDAPVTSKVCGSECWPETSGRGPLHVADLEGSGEAEAVLDLYSGGAHCCSVVQVYEFDPGVMAYRVIERDFGDPEALLADLAGDGRLEFESADDRFAYEFTSFAYSGLPVQIWKVQNGRFVNVTRQFPKVVSKDARRQLQAFKQTDRGGHGLGFIAAWAADESLLGHHSLLKRTLSRELRAGHLRDGEGFGVGGARFLARLEKFLKKNGYE